MNEEPKSIEPNPINNKPKFSWKPMLITLFVAVVLAVIVGITTYYFMNQQASSAKTTTDKQIAELNQQVSTLTKSQTVTTATTTAATPTTTLQSKSISEWGIQGNYMFSVLQTPSTQKNTLTYTIKGNVLVFNSSATNTATCPSDGGYTGQIERNTADQDFQPGSTGAPEKMANVFESNKTDTSFVNIWHIGNYYYYYRSPQAPCGATDQLQNAEEEVNNETKQFFVSMRAI